VGVYGLTFAMVWVNVFIATAVARLGGERVRTFFAQGILTVVIVFVIAGYGLWRLPRVEFAAERVPGIRVGLLQGNIPQEEKWDRDKAMANLDVYRQGVGKISELVDLIVWPEASYPWPLDVQINKIDPEMLGYPDNVTGTLPYVMIGVITEKDDENYYNSALLFDAQGTAIGSYHKVHLVPFGEYVPYRKLLFFARKLTEPVGNFLAGTSYEPLWADPARIGILICYEDVFPEISRRMVKRGATLLANLTNDAWYGVSSAPYQHLALSVFRAVENRRYLLRATNTGVSAMISPSGRVLVESGLFEPSVIVTSVGLLRNLSPYTRLGDWFAWACLVYAGLGIAVALVYKWRRAREGKS
jgi:apolipoprotein N-acyltransferase